MAELFELSFCTSGLAPKSKLLRSPKVQYGFILKRSHHCGKNTVSLRFTEKAAHSNHSSCNSALPQEEIKASVYDISKHS